LEHAGERDALQPVGHIDVRDVAAVATQIAASRSAHAGKTYWPCGPQVLSGTEVAAVLSKVP
jgi:uncharacterized protein YbjT (DUF2867 family)